MLVGQVWLLPGSRPRAYDTAGLIVADGHARAFWPMMAPLCTGQTAFYRLRDNGQHCTLFRWEFEELVREMR